MKPCEHGAGYINEALRAWRRLHKRRPVESRLHKRSLAMCRLHVHACMHVISSTVVCGMLYWLVICLCGTTITYQCCHSFAIGTGAVSRLLALLLDLHWDFPDHFCFAHAIYLKWLPKRGQAYPNHPCGAAKRPHKGSLLSLVILRSIFYKLPVHLK